MRNGDRVEAGQQIATMGRSGNTPAKGDTHLHFELWRDGRKVDPLPELRGSERGAAHEGGARPAASATQILRVGAQGAGVTALQEQLNALGYKDAAGNALANDGHFGPATRDALLGLQRAQGIKADGIAGPQTWGKLSELSREAGKAGEAPSAPEKAREAGGSSSFVERMFAAVRNPESGSVQKVIDEFASTMKNPQWDKPASPMEQAPPTEPSKGSSDPQR